MGTKRTKFHPAMPPKKSRKDGEVSPVLAKNRARRAVILARTASGLAKLERARVGADMRDIQHLPTIVFLPRPSPPLILDDAETSQYKAPPITPPVDGFVEQLNTQKPNRKRQGPRDISSDREKVRASIAKKAARERAMSAVKRAA